MADVFLVGEKLFEELKTEGEEFEPSGHPRIARFISEPMDYEKLPDLLAAGYKLLLMLSGYLRGGSQNASLLAAAQQKLETALDRPLEMKAVNKACPARPFCVIYNIDVTDFKVPAFSLQPFVENALNYSKVNEKDGGYIMISTSSEGEFAKISITDNGVGFDSSQLKEGAHGINNCKERFRLLFNTEPVISSIVSVSTEITITVRRTAEVS